MSVYEVVFKGGHLLEVTAALVNTVDMLYFEYKEAV